MEVRLTLTQLVAMTPQGGSGGGGGMFGTVIMFSLIILIFYFMILRPQQKKQKERQQLLESVQKGDKVVTIGGVHGTVVGMEEKTVLVQIADNVKVKYEKSAISSINRGSDSPGKTS
jgi:preprotein translocase subunit YajC